MIRGETIRVNYEQGKSIDLIRNEITYIVNDHREDVVVVFRCD